MKNRKGDAQLVVLILFGLLVILAFVVGLLLEKDSHQRNVAAREAVSKVIQEYSTKNMADPNVRSEMGKKIDEIIKKIEQKIER